jgi:putative peptidoglycan lipid II flippase
MTPVRSSLIVGAAAALSRVLGFVRDLLIAQALGAGPVADAFLAAFRLPNLIRRVLGEGGLNPALIPALARLPQAEAARFAGEALAGLGLVLVALIAFVELTAGFAVLLLAPGLAQDPATLALAALCTRLGFPLVAGVLLTSLIAAVLNHGRRFVATALAPLIVNAVLIAALLGLARSAWPAERQAAALAALSSLAGFGQLALVALALRGPDAPIRLARPRFDARLKKLLAAVSLTIAASSALPLFVLVGTQAASFTPSAVSWLYFADRLMQLPFGIVASVAGIVLLPELARHHVAGRTRELVAAQNRALEIAWLVAAPAAIGLCLTAETIVAVLFERGAFGPDDTLGTAHVLQGLCLGLPFAVFGKVLAQTLSAQGAFAPQIKAIAAGLAATAAAAFLLAGPAGAAATGLAVSAGCIAHAGGLAAAVRKAGLWRFDRGLSKRFARVAAAGMVLAAALFALRALALPAGLASLVLLCGGGGAVYGLAAFLLGALTRADLALLSKSS